MDETDRARRQLAMIASSSNHYYRKDAVEDPEKDEALDR
jgi:hypothetical protein